VKIYCTTNDLGPIHGDLPTDPPPIGNIAFNRGYIIYLQLSGDGAFLNGRAFWTSYNQQEDEGYQYCPKNQDEFIAQILELADKGELLKIAQSKCEPFQNVDGKRFCFSTDVSQINFGWQPCNVTYIFNNAAIAFEEENPENELIHPVVFRKNKAVNGVKETYRANDSFYGVKVDNSTYKNASLLHIQNIMTIKDHADGDNISIMKLDRSNKFDYCLDIPISISQQQFMADGTGSTGCNAMKAITFVFDPPQGNGGGSGPPDYP
jgi:hypothetical protein